MPTLAFHRFGARLLVLLALMLIAPAAVADGRIGFLAARLKYPPGSGQADDFRVRTNAALALGATDDDDAISPLCGGLDDPSEVVRQAVAVALKRLLRPSSRDCLQRRAGSETNASVKAQIKRALDALDAAGASSGGAGGGGEAPPAANAKYYVSVSKVTNNTTRSAADVQRIVGGAIASKLAELGEYQMAPSGESTDAAKAALAKRKPGARVLPRRQRRQAGLLRREPARSRAKIAVFSYLGATCAARCPRARSLPGARLGDSSAEEQLMSAVAARAAELFARTPGE